MKNQPSLFKRTSDTTPLKEAIDKMLRSFRIKDKLEEYELKSSWEEMMGRPIARRTEKMYIKNHVLYVKLSSAPLRQELMNGREKVLNIIQKKFGKKLIKEILFH